MKSLVKSMNRGRPVTNLILILSLLYYKRNMCNKLTCYYAREDKCLINYTFQVKLYHKDYSNVLFINYVAIAFITHIVRI